MPAEPRIFICAGCGTTHPSRKDYEVHQSKVHGLKGALECDSDDDDVANGCKSESNPSAAELARAETSAQRSATLALSASAAAKPQTNRRRRSRPSKKPISSGNSATQGQADPALQAELVDASQAAAAALLPSARSPGDSVQNAGGANGGNSNSRNPARQGRGRRTPARSTDAKQRASTGEVRPSSEPMPSQCSTSAVKTTPAAAQAPKPQHKPDGSTISFFACSICKANFYKAIVLRHHVRQAHPEANVGDIELRKLGIKVDTPAGARKQRQGQAHAALDTSTDHMRENGNKAADSIAAASTAAAAGTGAAEPGQAQPAQAASSKSKRGGRGARGPRPRSASASSKAGSIPVPMSAEEVAAAKRAAAAAAKAALADVQQVAADTGSSRVPDITAVIDGMHLKQPVLSNSAARKGRSSGRARKTATSTGHGPTG